MLGIRIATVAALALRADALRKLERGGGAVAGADSEDQRNLMTYTVEFEECVGINVNDCMAIIQEQVTANPQVFEDRPSLNYDILNIREQSGDNYNMVGLRTNDAETSVVGILGDGMVWYPWQWCRAENDCYDIGPWDCDVGTPLDVDQCCNMIRASVPDPDVNGNYLECFADHPIGSVSNPVDYGRVQIHVNGANIVMRPPRNE